MRLVVRICQIKNLKCMTRKVRGVLSSELEALRIPATEVVGVRGRCKLKRSKVTDSHGVTSQKVTAVTGLPYAGGLRRHAPVIQLN